jgi:uncharacterized protein (DUF983 family)
MQLTMQETNRKQIAEDKKNPDHTLFLKRCPECHSKLENDLFSGFQYCTVCGTGQERKLQDLNRS